MANTSVAAMSSAIVLGSGTAYGVLVSFTDEVKPSCNRLAAADNQARSSREWPQPAPLHSPHPESSC